MKTEYQYGDIFLRIEYVISDVKNILKDTEHPKHSLSQIPPAGKNQKPSGFLPEGGSYDTKNDEGA